MTLSSSFFDKVKYKSSDFAARDADLFGSGCINLTDFPLTYPSPASMNVNVGTGVARINGGYRIANDANLISLTFAAADPTNPRVDIIQVGYTATTDANGDTTGSPILQIKQGVPGVTPIEPGADPNFIKLYAVNIGANQATVTSSNVIDRRALVPLNVDGTQIQNGGSVSTTDPAYLAVKNSTYVQPGAGITATAGTDQQTVAVSPATASALGGVKVGTGISVLPDGTISVTPYTLPSDVAKTDVSNNFTASQTFAGFTSKGTSYLTPQAVATSSQNYPSYTLQFQRSYWNGTAAVTGSSYLVSQNTGGFYLVGESGQTLFSVAQSGAFSSYKNTLDDGSGNQTLAGKLTFSLSPSAGTKLIDFEQGYGVYSDNLNIAGASGQRLWTDMPSGADYYVGPRAGSVAGGTFAFKPNLFQVLNAAGATEFQVNTTSGAVTTKNSTVDDGSGAFMAAGFVYSGKTGSGTGGQFRSVSDDGLNRWMAGILGNAGAKNYSVYNMQQGASYLTIADSTGAVTTKNNTLDDGTGKATFNAPVTNSVSGASVQQWLGRTGTSAGTVGIGGDANGFGVWDSTGANKVFNVNPTNKSVTTYNNTLDNGTGQATLAALSVNGTSTSFGSSATGNVGLEIGSTTTASTSFVDFHSSGNNIDNDARISVTGGTTTASQGTMNLIAGAVQVNGVGVLTNNNKGIANGVASLDGTGNVPASQLANASSVKARASDTQLTTTAATAVASYTPSAQGNFSAKVYVRVATAATNVTITVTYTDGGGTQTYTMQTGSLAVGSHSFPAYFFNATAAAISVNVTAGTANQVYASASIVGE